MKKTLNSTNTSLFSNLNRLVFAGQVIIIAAAFPLISYMELNRGQNQVGNSGESEKNKITLEQAKPKAIAFQNQANTINFNQQSF